ncbi:MAG TPA: sigma-70 family RNA polymerase sigma factor [Acidimicrobiia bacterium]|nr:sigma-70 family RNA polymerase sigma factor [Acidimicrobiia bacterium]
MGSDEQVADPVGTEDARFAELYPGLRRFAAVVRPSGVDPDDLVQEALTRLLTTRPLSECDDPGAYLRTAIVRIASNHRRSLARRRVALSRMGDPELDEPSYPSDLDELRHLSPDDRALLYLVVVEQRAHADVGRLLGCTEAAARRRFSRALRRLRTTIEETDDA